MSGTWFEHITIFYNISSTPVQSYMVYTIVVELHYSILVGGVVFFSRKCWDTEGDVYCVPVMVVAYVFVVVVVCSPIYEETLYRLLWPGRIL